MNRLRCNYTEWNSSCETNRGQRWIMWITAKSGGSVSVAQGRVRKSIPGRHSFPRFCQPTRSWATSRNGGS